MRKSTQLQALAILAGVLGVAAVSLPASAASDSTDVNLTVNAGALTITAPGTALALSAITCSTTAQNSTGTTGTVTITDTTGSFAGWSSTYKYTNLAGVTTASKLVRLASDATFDSNTVKYLSTTPSEITPGANSNTSITSYNTSQEIAALADLTGTGLSNAFNLASATTGNGSGTYTGTIGTTLVIPPFCRYPDDGQIIPQDYKGTLYLYVS